MNESTASGRSPIIPIAIAGVLVVAVTASVLFFLNRDNAVEFDPIASAELVPEDTHLFITFNTDFTSDPWIAIPQLLNALGVEDDVREDLREGSEEEDLDFDDDVVPALASIRRIGLAGQYVGDDNSEWVVFIDSRDPDRLLGLTVDDDTTIETERDDELGLDFDIYVVSQVGPDDTTAVTVQDGIIYVADEPEHISNFIRRQREQPPLSESQRFLDTLGPISENSLMVGYGNGDLLDHRDFRDVIDALEESAEIDPREAAFAFSVTASTNGFGARAIVKLASGFGSYDGFVTEPTDLDGLAALTPEDAIFFFAGSGLGDAFEETYNNLAEQTPELIETYVAPFEDFNGISVVDDLIPTLGNAYGFAVGGTDVGAEDFDETSLWIIGMIASEDPATLAEYLDFVVEEVEFNCLCDTDIDTASRAGYAVLEWPDSISADPSLAESDSFQRTVALLPNDPTTLSFLNIAALPEDLIADWTAQVASDPDDYAFDLEAILGFAFATSGDDTSLTFEMVMPIVVAAE